MSRTGVITRPRILVGRNNRHASFQTSSAPEVPRSMITPLKLLPRCWAFVAVLARRTKERERESNNAVIGFLPIRITGAIVSSSGGRHRRGVEAKKDDGRKLLEDRHFRERGAAEPEQSLCPRDYELASVRGTSILPVLGCIMGDDALITATSRQGSAFEAAFVALRGVTREETRREREGEGGARHLETFPRNNLLLFFTGSGSSYRDAPCVLPRFFLCFLRRRCRREGGFSLVPRRSRHSL
ncbi:hypothetical protein K0M31_017863 [Melipona bicolor]|uniref:Uncharacterized protein n=1 Tax=Melipona bicolor TaxID=60889 RepID=A0AA40G5N1_9HYME|nr:hypothetical protein K0M31_017863 [Melipona bicolor]